MLKVMDKAPVGRGYLMTGDVTTVRELVEDTSEPRLDERRPQVDVCKPRLDARKPQAHV